MRGVDMGTVSPERGRWIARLPRSEGRSRLGAYSSKHEAEAVLAAALRQLADRADQTTVGAWGRRWIEQRLELGRHREAIHDAKRWERYVGRAPIAEVPLSELEESDVRRWLTGLRTADGRVMAPQTARNQLSLLRVALEEACNEGLLRSNPARDVRPSLRAAESPEERVRLDAPDLEVLIALAWERLDARRASMLTVMAYAGIRPSEAFALRWEDVDFESRVIRIRQAVKGDGRVGPTKTRRSRRDIPLLPPAFDALLRAPHDTSHLDLVWPSRGGGAHTRGYASDLYRLPVSPGATLYSLRGTCGSLLLGEAWVERGWLRAPLTIAEVSRWLGHSNVAVTSRHYARHTDAEVRAKVNEPLEKGEPGGTSGPHPVRDVEPSTGLEPVTCGLRNRCSTD